MIVNKATSYQTHPSYANQADLHTATREKREGFDVSLQTSTLPSPRFSGRGESKATQVLSNQDSGHKPTTRPLSRSAITFPIVCVDKLPKFEPRDELPQPTAPAGRTQNGFRPVVSAPGSNRGSVKTSVRQVFDARIGLLQASPGW